jgi:predicted KAP-like P-loop ATPase
MWRDSETIFDLLDFDYLVETTKSIILDDSLSPSCIGVYGDWGSGKSSLMEMTQSSLSEEEDVLCIKFNGWLFEGYDDAKTALIGSILDAIEKNRTFKEKAKDTLKRLFEKVDYLKIASYGVKYGLDFLITGGVGTIADLTFQSVIKKVKDSGSEISQEDIDKKLKESLNSNEVRNTLKSFQDDFSKLLEETDLKRLVVFIDELDRCTPDTILDTLEAIRLFLFAEGTSFVIGADERQVMYAVRKKYPEIKGNQLDIGKEYLEKIIQYPIKIPQLGAKEVQHYIMCLLLLDEFGDESKDIINHINIAREKDFLNFKMKSSVLTDKFPKYENQIIEIISLSNQLAIVLSERLNGNPRHCKRFLNALSLRIFMAKVKEIELDKKVLAKLMLLEYFRDSIFKEIGKLQSIEEGKPKELQLIENNEWEEVSELGRWKEDTWFVNWTNIEPKLSEINLQSYFYFSRESLNNLPIHFTQNLSLEGESILQDLLSGGDSKRDAAIKKATNLNDFESLQVLKSIISSIESSAEIDTNIVKSLIGWGLTKPDLVNEVLLCLNNIPSSQMRLGLIPHISKFGKDSKKESDVRVLFDKWLKDNPGLKSAIENE